MSRIGRLPVLVPKGVTVNIKGSEITVKGPKGELRRAVHPAITVAMAEDKIVVTRASDNQFDRALHGLTRSLVAGMVEGVDKGFEKSLEIVGVGYRAQKTGEKLTLQLGFTHPVEVAPMAGITFAVEGNRIAVRGANKEVVGQMAANIRKIRPPDHYKGKGIRYAGEVVRLKAGKAVGKKK